ncbi:MAG TPA: hypothetical protein VN131_00900 [Mobilitalea sp.]|nr:hypothetical protein [Mobilitalea sp.]
MNIVFYVLVVILVITCSKAAFEFTYELYGPRTVDSKPGHEIIFQINQGESTMDVASKLEIDRAIVNKYSFYFKTKLQDKVILAGTYKINSSMTYDEILNTITDYNNSIVQDKNKENGQSSGQSSQQNSGQDATQNTQQSTNQTKGQSSK